jgi:hypothetical protein
LFRNEIIARTFSHHFEAIVGAVKHPAFTAEAYGALALAVAAVCDFSHPFLSSTSCI